MRVSSVLPYLTTLYSGEDSYVRCRYFTDFFLFALARQLGDRIPRSQSLESLLSTQYFGFLGIVVFLMDAVICDKGIAVFLTDAVICDKGCLAASNNTVISSVTAQSEGRQICLTGVPSLSKWDPFKIHC